MARLGFGRVREIHGCGRGAFIFGGGAFPAQLVQMVRPLLKHRAPPILVGMGVVGRTHGIRRHVRATVFDHVDVAAEAVRRPRFALRPLGSSVTLTALALQVDPATMRRRAGRAMMRLLAKL